MSKGPIVANLFGRTSGRGDPTGPAPANLRRQNEHVSEDGPLRNFGEIDGLETAGGYFFARPSFGRSADPRRVIRAGSLQGQMEDEEDQEALAEFDLMKDFRTRDNQNDRNERAGLPPNGVYRLPEYMAEGYLEKFFGPRYKNLLHISRKTGAHLNVPRDLSDPTIEMWGSESEIADAKKDLKKLADYTERECHVKLASRTFAKIRAAPSAQKIEQIRANSREAERQKLLRGPPPENQFFAASAVVLWPPEVNPTVIFGASLAALDQIRYDTNCFILWNPGQSYFQVLGHELDAVEECQRRIMGMYCMVAIVRRPNVKAYMVNPPSPKVVKTHVYLNTNHPYAARRTPYDGLNRDSVLVSLAGNTPTSAFLKTWEEEYELFKKANSQYFKRLVTQGIDDIFYFKGYVKMKVSFGQILLTGYKKPEAHNKSELLGFMDSIQDEKTRGELIDDIGGMAVAAYACTICMGSSFFEGVHYSTPGDVQNIDYFISVTFEIRVFDEDNANLFQDCRLEVDFEADKDDNGEFKVHKASWMRLEQEGDKKNTGPNGKATYRRRLPLSLDVIDLDNDLGWNFEIVAYKELPDTDIHKAFSDFLRDLSFQNVPDDSVPDSFGDQCEVRRISYTNQPGFIVRSVTQETKHKFWMGMSGYIFEISKQEHIPVSTLNFPVGVPISLTRDELENVKIRRRYTASMYNREWDHTFADQKSMGWGVGARWEPRLESFFERVKDNNPENLELEESWGDDPWEEFMGRIQQCIDVIVKAKKLAVQNPVGYHQENEEHVGEYWEIPSGSNTGASSSQAAPSPSATPGLFSNTPKQKSTRKVKKLGSGRR